MSSPTTLDCWRSVRERLLTATVPIGSGLALCKAPITADIAARLLNTLPLEDDPGDAYVRVNIINSDNTITLRDGKYCPVLGREDHPVTGISWLGADALARAVGARLPTVEEWQSAVMAHGTRFPWGDVAPQPALANYDQHIGGTSRVEQFPPSVLGFYDLLGNVGEWCQAHHPSADEVPVVGGGWNKPIREEWWQPRFKWRCIGTVAIGVRLVFEVGTP